MKAYVRGSAAALAVVALLGACSGGGQPDGGDSAAGSAALAPAQAPDGWTVQETGPVSLAVPGDWTATEPPSVERSGEGAQGWGFVAPAGEGESTNGVTVVVAPNATTDDVLQVAEDGNETAARTLGAHDATAESLTWPGAEAAAYSTYVADVPAGPGDGDVDTLAVHFESLVLDLGDGGQAVVTTYGPQDHASSEDVHTVLTTVAVP